VQVAILGPIEVRDGDRVVPVAGTRLRRLLLRLTVDVGRVVSAQELVDAIWGEELPSDVTGALQTLVSRLRRTLGDPALVEQVVGGYRLTLDRSAVDVHQFSALAGEGQRALSGNDAQGAAANLRAALGLWRGEALLDAGDAEYGAALASRYEAQRLDVVSGRIEADLQLGDATGVVSELRELVATHPLHERSTAQLMRALVATGRAAEALTAYEQFRRTLSDQLGTDPSSSLQEQHLQILRGAQAAEAPVRARRQAHRTNLRSALTSFIGRDDDAKRVSGLIESGRLTTIVGPGGAGKTRLAAEVGNTWIERLEGGVWFVPLAPVTDEHDIAPTILAALGMRENKLLERQPERMTRDAMGRLLEALGDATCLLVVDNCEHLVDGVAEVVDKVLTTCPRVRVLATSREPLGIDGESLCGLTCRCRRKVSMRSRPSPILPCSCSPNVRRPQTTASPSMTPWWAPASRSCAGSTVCRWRSSWPQRGCVCCRSTRSPPGSPTGSHSSPAASAPHCHATAHSGRSSSGAGTC
jgi:DNA-binding SARP family transcriptional activator